VPHLVDRDDAHPVAEPTSRGDVETVHQSAGDPPTA
jgi:hypothetical protein